MQLLQQEVMKLRGLIESLEYEISRQKSVGDERYLELDARLQSLISGNVSENDGAGLDQQSIDVLPDFDLRFSGVPSSMRCTVLSICADSTIIFGTCLSQSIIAAFAGSLSSIKMFIVSP